MIVFGIGDVSEVSNTTIFFKDEDGNPSKKKVNVDDLKEIIDTGYREVGFYVRAVDELHALYASLYEKADKEYPLITDEEIEAEYSANGRSSHWLDLTLSQPGALERRQEAFNKAFGVSEARRLAFDREYKARRVLKQAEGALAHIRKPHVVQGKGGGKKYVQGVKGA